MGNCLSSRNGVNRNNNSDNENDNNIHNTGAVNANTGHNSTFPPAYGDAPPNALSGDIRLTDYPSSSVTGLYPTTYGIHTDQIGAYQAEMARRARARAREEERERQRAAPRGSGNHSRGSHSKRPLDKRPDVELERLVWTHDETRGPPPTYWELERKREEFWHTRVEGKEDIWKTVKTVIEMLMTDNSMETLYTAREMLKAAEITTPHGSFIHTFYDVFGNKYKCPPWVVSDPTNVRENDPLSATSNINRSPSPYKPTLSEDIKQHRLEAKATGKKMDQIEGALGQDVNLLTAKFRLNNGSDHKVEFWTDEKIRDLQVSLMKTANIDSATHLVKFMLDGHELDRHRTLTSYVGIPKWDPERVISAYIQKTNLLPDTQLVVEPPAAPSKPAQPTPQPQSQELVSESPSENKTPGRSPSIPPPDKTT
ncbi:hypothetical protein TWF694_007892 [Orbilia ellipsospora]|uniref:DC-UbP/UBTD2 N-terminal domain-containing protein n=1 Tax=Orbilia ellipsospora TaxID=2528407 RepID=A0AAV9XJ31_9PEZI